MSRSFAVNTVLTSDQSAIHIDLANELINISGGEKATPVSADRLLIEDSEASHVKKWIQIGSLPSSGGGGGQLTTEEVQDIVGAMVSGNTETNLTITYDDTNGKLDFVLDSHTHAIADVTGLQAAIDGKAATSHTHGIADITDLSSWTGSANIATVGEGAVTAHRAAVLNVSSDAIRRTLTAAEALVNGDLCHIDASGEALKADASAEATCDTALAMCTEDIAASATGSFIMYGPYTTSGLTPGAPQYVSLTAGAITETKPSATGEIVRQVGTAFSATELFFNPGNEFVEIA